MTTRTFAGQQKGERSVEEHGVVSCYNHDAFSPRSLAVGGVRRKSGAGRRASGCPCGGWRHGDEARRTVVPIRPHRRGIVMRDSIFGAEDTTGAAD